MDIDKLTVGQVKGINELFSQSKHKKESIGSFAQKEHGAVGLFCVVRTYASGVHFGRVATEKPAHSTHQTMKKL